MHGMEYEFHIAIMILLIEFVCLNDNIIDTHNHIVRDINILRFHVYIISNFEFL